MSVKTLRNQLLAAIAMVLVAALALGSSTFAWFAVNNEVNATNMRVTAKTEIGLLINEVSTANSTYWDNEATAAQTSSSNAATLYPASTNNGTLWYHAASKAYNNSASAAQGIASSNLVGAYDTVEDGSTHTLTAITSMSAAVVEGSNAVRQTMGASVDAPAGYYVHYTYYLKGTQGTATSLGTEPGNMNVRIKSVTPTVTTTNSTNLNKSLRVGIRMKNGGQFYIYAPFDTETTTYYVAASSTATTAIANNTATVTDLGSIPAVSSTGTPIEVYIWYEGEDTNCKSANATEVTLDDIAVNIVFDLYTIPQNNNNGG